MKDENLERELKEIKNKLAKFESKSIFQKFKEKSRFAQGLILGLLITPLITIAGQITKSYQFNSGTVISSAQVNTNFDDLYNKINDMNQGAVATLSSNFNITCSTSGATYFDIPFDTLEEDDGNFNPATYTYTVSSPGYYNYSVKVSAPPVPSNTYTQVIINGGAPVYINSELILAKFNVGDTIKFKVSCDNKGNSTEIMQAIGNYFYIKKVF